MLGFWMLVFDPWIIVYWFENKVKWFPSYDHCESSSPKGSTNDDCCVKTTCQHISSAIQLSCSCFYIHCLFNTPLHDNIHEWFSDKHNIIIPMQSSVVEKKGSNGERLKEKRLFSSYPELPDGRSKEEKHFLAHTKCKRKHCFKMNLLTRSDIFFSR